MKEVSYKNIKYYGEKGFIHYGHTCKNCAQRWHDRFSYDEINHDWRCTQCGHWQGKNEKEYLIKNGYKKLEDFEK